MAASKKKGSKKKKSGAANEESVTRGEEILTQAFLSNPEHSTYLMDVLRKSLPGVDDAQLWKIMAQQMEEREKDEERSQMTQEERQRAERRERRHGSAFRDLKECNHCHELKAKLFCSNCKCRVYCDKDCQRAAWSVHKKECKTLASLRTVPQLPRDYAETQGWHWALGVVRTPNHGCHFVVMDGYDHPSSDRYVPLAHEPIADPQGQASNEEIAKCLKNAMFHPEFDTYTAGWRRPYNVTIISGTPNADQLAAVCRRLDLVVKNAESDDHSFMQGNFCLHMGWRQDMEEDILRQFVATGNCMHSLEPNGIMRLALKEQYDEWNRAASEAKPHGAFPSRDQVLALPVESMDSTAYMDTRNATVVAVHEGVLYIFTIRAQLLYHGRVPLDPVSRRPKIDDVLGPLYKVIVEQGQRPAAVSLGNPSICSHTDIDKYEGALDGAIVRDNCSLSKVGIVESILADRFLPVWRESRAVSI